MTYESKQPTLRTERLLLRPFRAADAADVRRLAGAREIALGTLNVPHPYPEGEAERWIGTHQGGYERGEMASFAITLSLTGELLGALGLKAEQAHERAELGYWVGVPYWRQGFCTEAARAVLDFGFRDMRLNRIHAHHFVDNPGSGGVLRRIGMRYEGRLRQHIRKEGEWKDLDAYALLRSEWLEMTGATTPLMVADYEMST